MTNLSFLKRLFLLSLFSCISYFVSAQVVINEYMVTNLCSPHNPNSITDNFGECEDWVEFYNTSGTPFDLQGYYITDRLTNLDKWQFPAGSVVPANGFLRIWLSGRPAVPFNLANIHVDFKLGQMDDNEVVALVDPDGSTIVDMHMMDEPTQLGHTRGRLPDGADNWVIFTTPTIQASNNASTNYADYAPRPIFSQPAGYHGGAINLELSLPDANPDFIIRYTLNGTFPTNASPAYTGPINLSTTTVVTAATFSTDGNFLRSFYEFSTFFFGADQHTMYTASVSGDQMLTLMNGSQIIPLTALQFFDENGQRISKSFGDTNKHGNDSWAYDQRGFDWIDRDKMGYSDATHLKLFRGKDREEFKRFMFKAAANDNYDATYGNPAHIRDVFVMSLSQVGNLDLDERTAEFCAVYVNGQYWGVYDYREKVDDWQFTEYYYGQGLHDIDFLKTWGGTWAEYGSANDWNALRNFILSNDMTNQTNYDYVKTQLNVMSLIDYFAINTWIVSADWLNWNTGWWKGNNEFGDAQKWRYILWDMDASFDHYTNYTGIPDTGPTADPCFGEQMSNPGGQGHTNIVQKLLENEEFFNTMMNRYMDLHNTVFSCDFAIAHLDSLINIIDPEMPRQIARWGGSYNQWQANVQMIRDFILERCEYYVEGMEDCYDVEAVEITVMIEGEGEVQLNSITITPDMQPWTGTYFIDVPIDLTAIEYAEGTFQFWESLTGDLGIGDGTDFEIILTPEGNIIIVAHFIPLEKHEVTFIVEPPGAGQIELDGTLLTAYPHTDSLSAGVEHNLQAIAADGWGFLNWESTAHPAEVFTPDVDAESAGYTLEMPDTVIAYFEQLPVDITIEVDDPGTGQVIINGVLIEDYPYTTTFLPGDLINLQAVPAPGYQFAGWTFQNHVFPDLESLLLAFEITEGDVITAYFTLQTDFEVVIMTSPENFGTVELDGSDLGSYWEGILSTAESYALRAVEAGPFYEFVGWQSVNGATFALSADMENVTLTITQQDTIIAQFVELPNYAITVRVEPEGTGRVMLDWVILPHLPWSGNALAMDHTDFKAIAHNEWKFSHWTTQAHAPSPNPKVEEMWIDLIGPDEIVAHFEPREFAFYMPTSFSPNGDGINDIFRPVGNEWNPVNFRMQIFNRLGELIFETTDPLQGWDGSETSQTHYAQVEVYVYQVEVQNAINSKNEIFTGHVTVLR